MSIANQDKSDLHFFVFCSEALIALDYGNHDIASIAINSAGFSVVSEVDMP